MEALRLEMVSDEYSVDSLDSTNSDLIVKVLHVDCIRIDRNNWSHVLVDEIKEAWRERAVRLNLHPLPGKFEEVTRELGRVMGGGRNEVLDNLLQNLMIEWETTFKVMKRCITRPPKAIESS